MDVAPLHTTLRPGTPWRRRVQRLDAATGQPENWTGTTHVLTFRPQWGGPRSMTGTVAAEAQGILALLLSVAQQGDTPLHDGELWEWEVRTTFSTGDTRVTASGTARVRRLG